MCAAKSTFRPTLRRVAKHLYRRGNSYEFRKVIPPYAREAFGGIHTYSRSFGDVSRREADHLAAECRRHCDRLIAGAGKTPDPTARVKALQLNTRVPERGEIDKAVRAWVLEQEVAGVPEADRELTRQRVRDFQHIAEITPVHLRADRWGSLVPVTWVTESIAKDHSWSIPPGSELFQYIRDRVGRAQREIAVRLKAELNFEDRPTPTHAMFDEAAFERDRAETTAPFREAVPIMDIFEGYLAEQRPASKTVKKWRAALLSLIEHLRHDDAARVTAEDIIAWKDALLASSARGGSQRSAGTVRNGYLGAVKPVFGWAADNRKIERNPVSGVTVRVPKRVTNRPERGYTRLEARMVLGAALATDCNADPSFGAFARRWLPWLCAYTGARVTEMAQLRRSDVAQDEDGIWFLFVRPDAGSQKSGRARRVPLHPHLIEQGFLDAVNSRTGPLFFDPSRKKPGSSGNSQAQKAAQRVADWVRSLGLTDKELQPNHGWRHAFISAARGIIDGDVRRAIVAHSAGADEHQEYGHVALRVMRDCLERFPHYTA